MYLITKWFGTFLCNKKGIQKKIIFPKDKKEISERLQLIENKEILSEEKKIVKDVEVIVSERRLQKIGNYCPDDSFFKDFEVKSEDFDFPIKLLNEASIILAKNKVDKKLKSEDLQVIQMVNALDDLIQTSNLLSERLECWSILPRVEEKIEPLENTFDTVNEEIKHLEEQIDCDMEKVAPNISILAGSLIGARLISLSGSLERLALFPASTVQILGAEKSLFRFKKEGGRPPKHGVIFQHKLVNKAPRSSRGKIARILATKISIAAKADAFTRRDISKELIDDLKKRVDEIRNQ